MSTPPSALGAQGPARKPVRLCVRCDRITDEPVVVSEVHSGSGPGFNVYACPACAPCFPPLPDVLELFEDRGGSAGAGKGAG
ncbi:hypothetical protein [Streptomyces thermolilacinus]|uniref:hypothetical protein n=1 Tax=Streptomyces thermolilacinus TaxID=285540 RepID=UPI0033E03721